ncbi:hypothetical protein BKA65DRAFT_494746 [Rhexocercosporidium sp. MPI-PUGE-AT-0058]|nr:hypothetical protein BKA65DRAFT_494746 [Rhexocercosporidium sp. MPI-PUGE-AT-0058]
MDGNPGVPPGTVPPEKEYTEIQMAQLHAAMMEELGIGRTENLPLADKGAPVEALRPLKQPKKHLNSATAAWHTLHLEEGADPKDDLDNIADGQLYRLRRGASSSGSRGNTTPRGGHFSSGNRGGARGNRSGYGGNRFMGPGRQDDRSQVSSFTPKSFLNDARQSARGSTHMDLVEARLRGPAPSSNLPPQRQSGHAPSSPPRLNRQSKANANARPSIPSSPQMVQSSFKLDDGDGFLKWAGIGNSATTQPLAIPKSVASQVSQSPQPTPAEGLPRSSATVPSTPNVASPAQVGPPTSALGSQGLSGSKWGQSPQQPLVAQNVPALQQPSSIIARPFSFTDRIVIRQNNVKITKNNATVEKEGIAAMTKKSMADELHTLALIDSLTGTFLVDETVTHDAVFDLHGSTVTYRAVQQTSQKPPTWKITFPLPLYANSFTRFVILDRSAAGHVARVVSDMDHPPSDHSASLETSSDSAPEAIGTSKTQHQKTEHGYGFVPETYTGSQFQYHAGYELGNGTSTGAFAQQSTADNVETLITLGDDEEAYIPPSTIHSDVFDLLEAVSDSNTIENLFNALGGDAQFFDHISQGVVAAGGKPIKEVSTDELISDPVYLLTLQNAVGLFLSNSETFTMLPEDYAVALVQYQSQKIMEFAVPRRDLALYASTTLVEESTVGSELVEENAATAPITTNLEHKDDTELQASSQHAEDSAEDNNLEQLVAAEDTRIKYSSVSLLGLRDHAVVVEINEQPVRERRPTTAVAPRINVAPFRAAPPVTSADGWQAFSAAESKSAATLTMTPMISTSASPAAVRDAPLSTSWAPATSTILFPETSLVAPAESAVNQWQSFAASEQLKTASEVPESSPHALEEVPRVALPAVPMNVWQTYAAAKASNDSAKDQDTTTVVPDSAGEVPQPVEEVKSAFKSSISTASVASTTPSTVVSPQKGQETDDALWAALLGSVGSSKPFIKSEPQDTKGLNIRTSVAVPGVGPMTPVIEQSKAAPPTQVKVQSTPESSFMPHAQVHLQSSAPAATPTPASQAMRDKIAAALTMKLPFSASSAQSPADSLARQPAAGGPLENPESQLKADTQVKLEKMASPPTVLAKSEPDTKSSLTSDKSHLSTMMASETLQGASTPQTVPAKAPVVKTPEVKLGGPLPAVVQPAKLTRALDEGFNKVLKGAPGLSASKWADESTTPQFTKYPRIPPSTFQPTPPGGGMYYPQGPHANQFPTPGFAPVLATVLVKNADGTYREETGMVKAGSVPIVAHAPIPRMGHQPYVENVRPSSGHMNYPTYPTNSTFPVRPTAYQQSSSFEFVDSETKINPVALTFKPSPQRPQTSASGDQRTALSPSRGNLQAQLQSRLNNSMTGPRIAYQGPQL